MSLSKGETGRILAVLEEMTAAGHAAAYCIEHLAARAGLRPDKMTDLRTFVGALRDESFYVISEPGICDAGPHQVAAPASRAGGGLRLGSRSCHTTRRFPCWRA
jgi:hypothetical protein